MSNSLAIAAVTAALRNLLDRGVRNEGAAEVTTLPLDKAKSFGDSNFDGRLNLFLYHTQPNSGWRNLELPRQVKPGETGSPPLGLDLYYLITAYERTDGDVSVLAHRLLGAGMRTLHDHPLLGADEIEAALAGSGLPRQIERLRITPQPMSVEELSKLWVIFQTEYRITAAYQVSVVLIESTRSVTAPLPVLRRGAEDRGPTAVAASVPTLLAAWPEVEPPGLRLSTLLGDDVVITGERLPTENFAARFTPASLAAPIELGTPLAGGSATEFRFHLPSVAESAAVQAAWAPGFYSLTLVITRPGLPSWTTNAVPFMLAPAIALGGLAFPAGTVNLGLTCSPRLRDGQQVFLLFGDRQVSPASLVNPADSTQPTALTFQVPNVPSGRYVVRLRVDGVDSLPVVSGGTPPTFTFDPAQTVTIT